MILSLWMYFLAPLVNKSFVTNIFLIFEEYDFYSLSKSYFKQKLPS